MPVSMLVTWQKSFETGIKLVDEQHKELIGIINLFYVQCKEVYSAPKTIECLKDFQRCTEVHFQMEESFLIHSKYPLFRQHQASHSEATFQVKRLLQLLNAGDTSLARLEEAKKFILTWLLDHLRDYDEPFFEYYKEYLANNPQ